MPLSEGPLSHSVFMWETQYVHTVPRVKTPLGPTVSRLLSQHVKEAIEAIIPRN